MLADPELVALPIADEQRIEDPARPRRVVASLESGSAEIRNSTLHGAEQRGRKRYKLGYTAPLLATHVRILEKAIYDVIHKNLSSVNLSFFMFELKHGTKALLSSLSTQSKPTWKLLISRTQGIKSQGTELRQSTRSVQQGPSPIPVANKA